jgi:hypothetical protein
MTNGALDGQSSAKRPHDAPTDITQSVAAVFTALVAFVGGSILQMVLWHKPGAPRLDALGRHGYLWFLYVLLSLLIVEHALKWMKRLF